MALFFRFTGIVLNVAVGIHAQIATNVRARCRGGFDEHRIALIGILNVL